MATCVAVDLRQIVDGWKLRFPIYDPRGVLLLSAGTEFTAEHRQLLAARGVTRVIVNETDTACVAVSGGHGANRLNLLRLDGKLNERLDGLIRSGMLGVRNAGPALAKTLAKPGARQPGPREAEGFQKQYAEGSAQVEELVRSAINGDEIDGGRIGAVADFCIEALLADIDSALAHCGLRNRDPSLSRHAMSVAMLGVAIAIDMGFDAANVRLVGTVGLVQDLGMARVPEEIRNAERRLTPIECVDVQRHAIHTADILEHVKEISPLVQLAAYQVHERPDGSGYPRGREKKCIHPFSRILHVADAYLAMTSPRPFRPPLIPYAAMECLLRQAEKNQVDSEVMKSLLRVMSLFPIGSYVRLSDGSLARVIRANARSFSRPFVALVQDASGSAVERPAESALIDLSTSDLKVKEALPAPGSNEIPLTPEIADWSVRVASQLADDGKPAPDSSEPASRQFAAP